MPRKIVSSLLFFVCGALTIVFFWQHPRQNNDRQSDKYTPEAILQAELQRKIQRRAKGYAKPQHPDEFAKFHRAIRTKDNESAPGYSQSYKLKELEKARTLSNTLRLKKDRASLPWVERGPGNVGGRTRGLVVDPEDPTGNTWFAGSVGGGIWKTRDAGQSWENKTPDLPNLATTVIAIAASNPDVMYAGTGEGFFNVDAITGDGIFKSTDHGETWHQLTSTAGHPDFQNVNRIVVDPENENLVLVCTNSGFFNSEISSGIFRSEDGGSTWSEVYNSDSHRVQQIVANPQNFQTLYAAVNSAGVVKSMDSGLTWQESSNGIQAARRIELAIAPTDTSRIYASVEVNSSVSNLYFSEDAGTNWLLVLEEGSENSNWLGGQGWYDNTIAVHPFDENTVFVGGINLWKISVKPGSLTRRTVSSVEENNTASFLSFVNFGGSFLRGGLSLGTDFGAVALDSSDFVSVEIRFGPGLSQMAHRFSAPDGPGVPFETYQYEDYSQVPFQVWDVTNNRQLMASFRDRLNDGAFNLIEFDSENLGREYIFVNSVAYDPDQPNPNIAETGGEIYKGIYFLWPILTTGATWEPSNLPESNLRINFETVKRKFRVSSQLTNWFPGLPNPEGGVFPFVHADHHNLVMLPGNEATHDFAILNANDGGVEISYDGGDTWNKTLNGYNTSQFYGVDKKPGANEYIGGTQDNGTWRSNPEPNARSSWLRQLGGDGFDAVWHSEDPNKIMASIQFNDIRRSLNGGLTWRPAVDGLTDVGSDAPFITVISKSKLDPNLLFAVGASGVWRSDNFAEHWTLSPIPEEAWGFSGAFPRVKISQANPQVVWAGTRMSEKGRIHVSTDGGLTFQPTQNFSDVELGRISGLATHPLEDSTAYLLFSFAETPKILRTTDLGQSWEDISGFEAGATSSNGFPDVAVYSLQVMPHNPDEIWVGTEIGLFVSTDGGGTWAFADNGLPAVSIWDMKVVDDQVVVATHGRGVWSVTIPELLDAPQPNAALSPRLKQLAQVPSGNLEMEVSLPSIYDSTHVLVNDQPLLTLINIAPLDTVVSKSVTEPENVSVTVVAFRNAREFRSPSQSLFVTPLLEPKFTYVSNFDSETTEVVGDGFEIANELGFANNAVHSLHPYPNDANLIYLLSTPIIVAPSESVMRYDDVALVEPGANTTNFRNPNFKDFAIVEATTDGRNWVPLSDGYDARYDSDWLQAHRNGEPGDASLFRTHTLDVSEQFSPGDTLLIRFRLFSDTSVNGWGWAIDNIRVQESVTSVASNDPKPEVFGLAQNYPNPFNPTTQIQYALPKASIVHLAIYNVLGQKVRELVPNIKKSTGIHTIEWDGRNDSGKRVASGVYVYRLEAGEFVKSRKMMLLQ